MNRDGFAARAARAAALLTLVAFGAGGLLASGDSGPILLALIAAGIAFVVYRVIQRQVLPVESAISRLAGTAARVAEGDLDERAGHSSPHLETLVNNFNEMVDELAGLVDRSEWNRARIESVFSASTDPMVAVASDMSIQIINPAAERLFGVTRKRALHHSLIESARDYEIDMLVRRVLDGGERAEEPLINFGARRVPLRAVAVPIAQAAERGVLLILSDLTEVQRLHAVRRDFLSNVSHEIRTPLASMRAVVDVIEDDVDDEEQRHIFVGHLRANIDRLTGLVNELLDLSRIESGAVELSPEMLDGRVIIDEAIDTLRQQAVERGITITVDAADDLRLEADRDSLVRVATNLLHNAIKFSPEGGTVRIIADTDGQVVSFRFEDDGPGINPENLDRVFERFYKADSARNTPGSGLGLSIVKHTVRAHGGLATVESEPGNGAAFIVHFPKRFIGPHRQAA